jgi:hypothetical protein
MSKAARLLFVTLKFPVRAFTCFDRKLPERDAWHVDPGTFEIRAASSSRDVRLRATATVKWGSGEALRTRQGLATVA